MVAILAAPVQPRPSLAFVIMTGVAALAIVAVPWITTGSGITLVHEGGHAFTSSAVGGQVVQMVVRPRGGGGYTESEEGKGLPEFAAFLAGYLAPPLFGLTGAILLNVGRTDAMLWLSLFFLGLALLVARKGYTYGTILVMAALIVLVLRYGGPGVRLAFAYTWIWYLLIGGVRSVLDLSNARQGVTDTRSDAYHLRRLSLIPAPLWVGFYGLFAFGALVAGAMILAGVVGPPPIDPGGP